MAYEFFNILGFFFTDYIQGTASLFNYPFTVNLWFYPTVTGVGNMNLLTLHNTTNDQRHSLIADTNTNRFIYTAFNTFEVTATTTVNYNLNAWNMATAVATSQDSRRAYINNGGSATNTTRRAVTTPTRWLVAGSYAGGIVTPSLNGRIAEIGIWNSALGADDISSLYTGQKPTMIRPQNLKVYIPLIRNIQDVKEATSSVTSVISDTVVANHPRRYG